MAEIEANKPRGPCRPGDPDEKAVARMLDGHEAARELDKKYRGGLVNRASGLLRDRDRAETVVQDTLAEAFNQVGTFKGQSSYFTWLYGIYKYRLLKERKAVVVTGKREVGLDAEGGAPGAHSSDPESTRQRREDEWVSEIERALTIGRQHTPEADHVVRDRLLEVVNDIHEFLTPQTREVFYLMVAGLSFGEIARVLDVSDGNVRNHVKRGREVLKAKRDERGEID
jgi:RNA polymerase sigma-70 factor (ECF subfamily)